MIKVNTYNFSVRQICESGQCFRLEEVTENNYITTAFGRYLELEQTDNETIFYCTVEEYETIWKQYFDLETDYTKFIESVSQEDVYLYRTVQFGSGIRILKQDIWEMIISFIISQQNNIKRIKKSIALLCEKFGEEKYSTNAKKYFAFPTIKALANTSLEELNECNLGYRSRYILNTANSILKKEIDLESLKQMNYMDSKKELMKLYGVGEKVADCVCLFALHHLEAFPVDTHIKKVLEKYYPKGFPFEKFAKYSGVIQQYIFYYDLKNKEI